MKKSDSQKSDANSELKQILLNMKSASNEMVKVLAALMNAIKSVTERSHQAKKASEQKSRATAHESQSEAHKSQRPRR